MKFLNIFTLVKPYHRQPQGQVWPSTPIVPRPTILPSPPAWQERIKVIQEKYPGRYSTQSGDGEQSHSAHIMPLKGMRGRL
jgi:hypothetical protein